MDTSRTFPARRCPLAVVRIRCPAKLHRLPSARKGNETVRRRPPAPAGLSAGQAGPSPSPWDGAHPMPSPIEDYALIGDCHTAALVARDGSMDWLCLPRFDSGACFAALLGTPEHGRWQIAPAQTPRRITRRYRPGTLILETEFETETGTV